MTAIASPHSSKIDRWVATEGRWTFTEIEAKYSAPESGKAPHGVAISRARLKRGSITTTVNLEDCAKGCGRILFGASAGSNRYFSAGIGGYSRAYLIDEYNGNGWRALDAKGLAANLQNDRDYEIRVAIAGQRVELQVDGIPVAHATLPHPLEGDQVGLFAWGEKPVSFHDTTFDKKPPRAFVVMQYAEPYNSLYREVIKKVAEESRFEVFRADDMFKPGIILQDIIESIRTADVIIAEITPANPNVYYEIGYAHAMGKPTILLAERGTDPSKALPFDISGFRVIFYDDTIAGKHGVEATLQQHLSNINAATIDDPLHDEKS